MDKGAPTKSLAAVKFCITLTTCFIKSFRHTFFLFLAAFLPLIIIPLAALHLGALTLTGGAAIAILVLLASATFIHCKLLDFKNRPVFLALIPLYIWGVRVVGAYEINNLLHVEPSKLANTHLLLMYFGPWLLVHSALQAEYCLFAFIGLYALSFFIVFASPYINKRRVALQSRFTNVDLARLLSRPTMLKTLYWLAFVEFALLVPIDTIINIGVKVDFYHDHRCKSPEAKRATKGIMLGDNRFLGYYPDAKLPVRQQIHIVNCDSAPELVNR